MHQTFAPANIDECAKVLQADHRTLANFAHRQLGDQRLFALDADFAGGGALGQDQPVAVAVDFHDLDADGLVDHGAIALFGRAAADLARATLG